MKKQIVVLRLSTRIYPDPNAGGPAKYAYFLPKHVQGKKIKIIIISSNPYSSRHQIYHKNSNFEIQFIPVRSLSMKNTSIFAQIKFSLFFILYSINKIIQIKRHDRIDLIHADSPSITGIPCLFFLAFHNIPYIYTYHGVDYKFRLEFFIYKIINQYAKKIIIVSRKITRYFKYLNWNFSNKLIYIPLGIEVPNQPIHVSNKVQFENKIKNLNITNFITPKNKIILYVGRMVFNQKVQGMIDFFHGFERFLANIDKKQPEEIILIYIGDGYYKNELQNVISQSLYQKNVILLGFRDDVQDFYSISSLSALTSYVEGFPNVILESMISGVPCLCTDVGEMKDIVGNSGMLVKPGNIGSIGQNLTKYFNNPSFQQDLIKKSFFRVKKKFNWNSISRIYQKLYLNSKN